MNKQQNHVLRTEALFGGYGNVEIIHGINLHIDRKEIVSIIGPNGSGKSTFIKVIYGIATYHSGQVWFNYKDRMKDIANFAGNQLVKHGVAYVPQRNNIFPNMTIRENLEMGGYTLPSTELEGAINNVFDTYPVLGERQYQKARVLSGGQRQMLALGRALMIKPSLIILDEPSAALQPSLVMDIMELVKNLRDEENLSVLMVEQNTKSALRISDRGYILAAGQIVHEATGEELLYNTDLAAYYLGNVSK